MEDDLTDLSGQYLRHEARGRFAHLLRRLFLEEMGPLHHDRLLVGPGSAELALRTNQEAAGLSVDEQLRDQALRQPFRIGLDDRDDVRGLARDRQLARPSQYWLAARSRVAEIAAIDLHRLRRDMAQRQQIFDE